MGEADRDDLVTIIDDETGIDDIPKTMPLMPVRDVVVFSDMVAPLYVGRDRSIRSVEEAVDGKGLIFLAAQKEPETDAPKPDDIYTIGTVARILRVLKLPDGNIKALVQGVCRASIKRYARKRGFYKVQIEVRREPSELKKEPASIETEALMRNVREAALKILALRGEVTNEVQMVLEGIDHPGRLADLVAANLRLKVSESQSLLENDEPIKRLNQVNNLLTREVELSTMQAKIQSAVKDEISRNQRDFFLREQVRAINRELGEGDEKGQEIAEYEKKIKKAKMLVEAAKEAKKQLRRLGQMHADSAESSVIRTYLDWLVELPWSKASKESLDLARAKEVLDSEHYGLEKIKERILEYLSVRKLNPQLKGSILCFVGPPGVGKTSLGRAIAKAMKRKFVRISLGGIRDEAEIRGHRRTYIGALPGRILQGLRQCGVNNPVFMMDEIDKLGADFRGDPSSALLEALDPEQNAAFSDHYLNLAFDLSQVLFILTANVIDTIPPALLDRMEVIPLSGYTDNEKLAIARQFLLPRQIKENGLTPKQVKISAGALLQMINEYTAEAGVRNLERELGAICRKIARKVVEGEDGVFTLSRRGLKPYLGLPRYDTEMENNANEVGLATGLAWTQAGGEPLYIEATVVKGKGELMITGQLGDVMQESARAALSYVRTNLDRLGLTAQKVENSDIHIHVPAGAIPKDGPSAGIAMATALISALTQKEIEHKVAMTGEITLRGRVLPIGGLKEKALGALRAGIVTMILPEKNRRELTELPSVVRRKIDFKVVKTMDEVIPLAMPNLRLIDPGTKKRSKKAGKN